MGLSVTQLTAYTYGKGIKCYTQNLKTISHFMGKQYRQADFFESNIGMVNDTFSQPKKWKKDTHVNFYYKIINDIIVSIVLHI